MAKDSVHFLSSYSMTSSLEGSNSRKYQKSGNKSQYHTIETNYFLEHKK